MGRFPRVRLREGYHPADVDEFLDKVEATLAGRPRGQPITAEDIRAVLFRTVRMGNGYDEQAVDDELDRLERVLTERAKRLEHEAQTAQIPAAPAMASGSAAAMSTVPAAATPIGSQASTTPPLHHIELWTAHLWSGVERWGWLLGQLGWSPFQQWDYGRSWRCGGLYLVLEESPSLLRDVPYDRMRAGLNHLAFRAASREQVDVITANASYYGWGLLFADRHPHAGGPDHYAAYLEDHEGFEVEVVAPPAG
jgi:DivIVA domain-containing protein